jgi:hypothetical protein
VFFAAPAPVFRLRPASPRPIDVSVAEISKNVARRLWPKGGDILSEPSPKRVGAIIVAAGGNVGPLRSNRSRPCTRGRAGSLSFAVEPIA